MLCRPLVIIFHIIEPLPIALHGCLVKRSWLTIFVIGWLAIIVVPLESKSTEAQRKRVLDIEENAGELALWHPLSNHYRHKPVVDRAWKMEDAGPNLDQSCFFVLVVEDNFHMMMVDTVDSEMGMVLSADNHTPRIVKDEDLGFPIEGQQALADGRLADYNHQKEVTVSHSKTDREVKCQ